MEAVLAPLLIGLTGGWAVYSLARFLRVVEEVKREREAREKEGADNG